MARRDAVPDAFLQVTAKTVWKSIHMAKLRQAHPAFGFGLPQSDGKSILSFLPGVDAASLLSEKTLAGSLTEQEEWLRTLGQMDSPIFRVQSLVPPINKPAEIGRVSNFLTIQVLAKTTVVKSWLRFLEGKADTSLPALKGMYTLAELLKEDRFVISLLIGVAVEFIVSTPLEFHLLNVCQTPEEVANFKTFLDGLDAPYQKYHKEYFIKRDLDSSTIFQDLLFGGTVRPAGLVANYTEAEVRIKMSKVTYDLLKTVAAGRYHLLTTGEFPKSEADFSQLLPQGLPADIFSTSSTLKFNPTTSTLQVYSLGPDGVDDGAAFQYDSTNGSKSRGDVIRTLPRKSEYPYQKNGVRAKDAADLLRQYQNGLPIDPFADSRPLPLSILESSSTETLRVFSFGPSCNEKAWVDSVQQSSDVLHVSPPGASLPRSKQKVFLRQDTPGQGVSGFWIQPSYDPTNGTSSGGTLHLDIPKP